MTTGRLARRVSLQLALVAAVASALTGGIAWTLVERVFDDRLVDELAERGAAVGRRWQREVDDVATSAPPSPWAIMCFAAARKSRKTPSRLVVMTRRHSSSETSGKRSPLPPTPALAKTESTRPPASSTDSAKPSSIASSSAASTART